MGMPVTRRQVLGFRVRAQQLDRAAGALEDTAVLDIGVQDTGPDGGLWALAVRGVDVSALTGDELATAWTIRGAPHLYLRSDLPAVAAATAPFSDADAGKRIFDASKPLKAAGISNLEALDTVAAAMRSVVTAPMVKGEMSGRLTALLPEPYLRFCRPCDATHVFEMPFRLAALRAGLELEPGTSPPVLRPVPGLTAAETVPPHLDVVRGQLRLLGPTTPKLVAGQGRHVHAAQCEGPQPAVRPGVLHAEVEHGGVGQVTGGAAELLGVHPQVEHLPAGEGREHGVSAAAGRCRRRTGPAGRRRGPTARSTTGRRPRRCSPTPAPRRRGSPR